MRLDDLLRLVLLDGDGLLVDGTVESLFSANDVQRVLARESQTFHLQVVQVHSGDLIEDDTWIHFDNNVESVMLMPFNIDVKTSVRSARLPCNAKIEIRDFHGCRLATGFSAVTAAWCSRDQS